MGHGRLLEEGLVNASHIRQARERRQHPAVTRLMGTADAQKLGRGAADSSPGPLHTHAPVDAPYPGKRVGTLGNTEFVMQGPQAVRRALQAGFVEHRQVESDFRATPLQVASSAHRRQTEQAEDQQRD